MNWFLSHKQLTGQRIALSLFQELGKLGESAFLDVKCELDLHNLEKLVELCDFFVFIYSDGVLDSEYCRKGIRQFKYFLTLRIDICSTKKEANHYCKGFQDTST
jgi:hypothetical protein